MLILCPMSISSSMRMLMWLQLQMCVPFNLDADSDLESVCLIAILFVMLNWITIPNLIPALNQGIVVYLNLMLIARSMSIPISMCILQF